MKFKRQSVNFRFYSTLLVNQLKLWISFSHCYLLTFAYCDCSLTKNLCCNHSEIKFRVAWIFLFLFEPVQCHLTLRQTQPNRNIDWGANAQIFVHACGWNFFSHERTHTRTHIDYLAHQYINTSHMGECAKTFLRTHIQYFKKKIKIQKIKKVKV